MKLLPLSLAIALLTLQPALAAFNFETLIRAAQECDPKTWKKLHHLARHAYFVDDRPQSEIDRPNGDVELLHSDKVVLIDHSRRIRGI